MCSHFKNECEYDMISHVGESIPIRLFLSGYELTPTMRDINKKFSVRYYLNLVLVDEEERRYFKQQVTNNISSTDNNRSLFFLEVKDNRGKNLTKSMYLYLVYGFFFGFNKMKTTIFRLRVKAFQDRIMTSIFFF